MLPTRHYHLHQRSPSPSIPIPISFTSEPITIRRNDDESDSSGSSSEDEIGAVSGLSESLNGLNFQRRIRGGTATTSHSLPPPRAPFLSSRGHGTSSVPQIALPSSSIDNSDQQQIPSSYGSLRSSKFYYQRRPQPITSSDEEMLSTSVSQFYPQSLPTYIDSDKEFIHRKWGDAASKAKRFTNNESLLSTAMKEEQNRGNSKSDDMNGHVRFADEQIPVETYPNEGLQDDYDGGGDDGDVNEEEEDAPLSTSITALGIMEESKKRGNGLLGIALNHTQQENVLKSALRTTTTVDGQQLFPPPLPTSQLPSSDVMVPQMNRHESEDDYERPASPSQNPDTYGAFDFELDE